MMSKFEQNQKGDVPVGTIMVIGLIAIPLVIALIIILDLIKRTLQ